MELTERKIPKWKEKEDFFKNQSFDDCLETLGINGAFINAKKIEKALKSPTQVPTKGVCEDQ